MGGNQFGYMSFQMQGSRAMMNTFLFGGIITYDAPMVLWDLIIQTCPKHYISKISTFKWYQQEGTLQIS